MGCKNRFARNPCSQNVNRQSERKICTSIYNNRTCTRTEKTPPTQTTTQKKLDVCWGELSLVLYTRHKNLSKNGQKSCVPVCRKSKKKKHSKIDNFIEWERKECRRLVPFIHLFSLPYLFELPFFFYFLAKLYRRSRFYMCTT